MAQKKKRLKKIRHEEAGEREPSGRQAADVRAKEEKLKKEAEALLAKIDAILKEHKKEACPKSHTPHVHLCDGTKMDLRKMFE